MASGVGQEVSPPWVVDDVIGCGVKFDEMKQDGLGRTKLQVFFTRNGHKVNLSVVCCTGQGGCGILGMALKQIAHFVCDISNMRLVNI